MVKKIDGHKQSSIRINNRYLVLDLLRRSEELTVAQISDEINLSKTTIWKIIDHFLQLNLVSLQGKAEASEDGGKKPELYKFNENCGFVISVAFMGDSIHLALTDAGAHVFYKEIIHIQSNEKLENVITIIADFIKKWQNPESLIKKGTNLFGIVIAASGVVDPEKGMSISASMFNSWRILSPIREMIEEHVELSAPFFIDNYNNYHAYAEKTFGSVQDKHDIMLLNANQDGVGGGIIADDKLIRGPRFLTGEFGHMRLNPYDTETCHCGGRGCFEQQISHDRLLKKAYEGIRSHGDSLLANGQITVLRIFEAANKGDQYARELLNPIIDWFAMGLFNANVVFNVETIIISGDYRNAGPYFLDELYKRMQNLGFVKMDKQFDIRFSLFDEEGILRGGACYAIDHYFEKDCEY